MFETPVLPDAKLGFLDSLKGMPPKRHPLAWLEIIFLSDRNPHLSLSVSAR